MWTLLYLRPVRKRVVTKDSGKVYSLQTLLLEIGTQCRGKDLTSTSRGVPRVTSQGGGILAHLLGLANLMVVVKNRIVDRTK